MKYQTLSETIEMIDDIDNADDNDIGDTLNILIKVFHYDNKDIKKHIIASILLFII